MKKMIPLVVILVTLLMLPSLGNASALEAIHVSLIDGDVQLEGEDTGGWVAASINMPLREGDTLWVPVAGRIELRLSDGSSIRFDGNSSFEVIRAEKDSYRFYLTTGHAYTNFRGSRGNLQIDTPVTSIHASEKAVFSVGVSSETDVEISVFRGSVHTEGRSRSTTVSEGTTLSFRGDTYADLHPLGAPDAWERWNRERDRVLYERRYSYLYLPEELSVYNCDFDRYGRWIYAREYGYVWRPALSISIGWAPYRHGRWVWIAGDYVWVSYEPWGWIPYHYGRWVFLGPWGWCWVPPCRGSVYWGPGFVGWIYTPYYIAWVPLAPCELYLGYGYFGPYSVNIVNINRTVIIDKPVYRHIHVKNAVTVVHRHTFGTAKPVEVKVKENLFLKERVSIGRPDFQPEKKAPVVRQLNNRKQPPSQVRNMEVKKPNGRQQFVREKTDSVKPARKVTEKRDYPSRIVKRDVEYPAHLTFSSAFETSQKTIPRVNMRAIK